MDGIGESGSGGRKGFEVEGDASTAVGRGRFRGLEFEEDEVEASWRAGTMGKMSRGVLDVVRWEGKTDDGGGGGNEGERQTPLSSGR